ncbi:DNA damage-regulated autophagy modulator protein 1-like [Sitodiplosis mosellana]|uniref:DNA damage-regulated autophagy modulator protein 1-like n=1 Tax=Sitodiplosis mosellana TaxID=263140 RepID=UPI0024444A43|nr:DNA damage-regulated autophagy modulator protein 1-like [Sitodiplosis mosellana]
MSKLFWIPIITFALCQSTFFSTSIAVIFHKNITWPYISEGGTYPPESCIFSELINMASVFLGLIIYIRYRQIERLLYHHVSLLEQVARKNVVSLWIGLMACIGLSIVANFQLTKLPQVHYFGAFSCFGLGTVYFWFQGFISYSVRSYTGSMHMTYARLVLATICTCNIFVFISTTCTATEIIFNEREPSCRYKETSAMVEWVMATAFCFFILSFTSEFKTITMDRPIILVIRRETRPNLDSSEPSGSIQSLSIQVT